MSFKERQKAAVRKEQKKAAGPTAQLRWLRISPRKVRLVVDLVRGKGVEEALNLLTLSRKAAALPVSKLIKSAVANADSQRGLDVDKLVVKTAYVNEGPTWRRWLPRAMGRATRLRKRTSHVTVILAEEG